MPSLAIQHCYQLRGRVVRVGDFVLCKRHSLSPMVMDLLGILVSNAEVSLYEDGACINFEANDGRGMLELVLPEGLYEVRVKNLRLTTSVFYPPDTFPDGTTSSYIVYLHHGLNRWPDRSSANICVLHHEEKVIRREDQNNPISGVNHM